MHISLRLILQNTTFVLKPHIVHVALLMLKLVVLCVRITNTKAVLLLFGLFSAYAMCEARRTCTECKLT